MLSFDGGVGPDTVDLRKFGAAVSVDLERSGSNVWTRDDQDLSSSNPLRALAAIANVENVLGSGLDDTIFGNGAANTLNGADGDDQLNGRDGDDLLNGQNGDDYLLGEDGVDRLDGGNGADTMLGGRGNDRYIVDHASDVVTEEGGQGLDTVQTFLSYTLTANVENLILEGGTTATGNSENNRIDGHGADSTLNGLVGDDLIFGYGGNDLIDGGLKPTA